MDIFCFELLLSYCTFEICKIVKEKQEILQIKYPRFCLSGNSQDKD